MHRLKSLLKVCFVFIHLLSLRNILDPSTINIGAEFCASLSGDYTEGNTCNSCIYFIKINFKVEVVVFVK